MTGRGRFIVFEGGEASGKSTQAARLASTLGALATREPGGTPLGEALRPMLLGQSLGALAARTELLLMVAARAEHVARKIRPTLDAGRDVVCDRFVGSTLAYQAFGRGLPVEDVLVANELATDGLAPDLTILLDVPPEVAASRRPLAGDGIEAAGAGFHARVRAGYLQLAAADPEGWLVFDATVGVEELAAAVERAVADRFGSRAGPFR